MSIGFPKPEPRLIERIRYKREREEQARVWRAKIWARDRGRCRVCRRAVKRTLGMDPLRGECHHLQTRAAHPELRFDVNNGVLTCLLCHLKLQRHEIELPKVPL